MISFSFLETDVDTNVEGAGQWRSIPIDAWRTIHHLLVCHGCAVIGLYLRIETRILREGEGIQRRHINPHTSQPGFLNYLLWQ